MPNTSIIYRVAGEHHLLIDFGVPPSLEANLRAIALAKALLQLPTLGPQGLGLIIDAVPSFTTVLVQYDSQRFTLQGLVDCCQMVLEQLGHPADVELSSRIIRIPVTYNDRWTQACYEDYCQAVKPIEPNIELVARLSGFNSIETLIEAHTQAQWWVGAVGFMAGLPTLMPLDSNLQLRAPKYDPPRTWTPKGTIGVAGGLTTIYPLVVPDGYQMLGRTPVPIFQPQQQSEPFQQSPVLFQVGDRVQFYPISEAEFEAMEVAINAGEFEYEISQPEPFHLTAYQSKTTGGHSSFQRSVPSSEMTHNYSLVA